MPPPAPALEAEMSAVHRGDGGTPRREYLELWTFPLLNPIRWENSPRCLLIILKRQRVEVPNTDPHARAVFRESITTGEVRL